MSEAWHTQGRTPEVKNPSQTTRIQVLTHRRQTTRNQISPSSVARENCLSVKSQALPEMSQSVESELPKHQKLRTDKDAPRCMSPSTATEAPRRANNLRDSDRINIPTRDK